MQIESTSVIFDATRQPAERRIAYFTSLCPLASGAILCGYQNGPGKHSPTSTIGLSRSTDGGRTWETLPTCFATRLNDIPGSLGAAELVEVEPGKLLLFSTWFDRSDPARPLFDPVTEGILRSRQLLALSTDDGASWSDWRVIPTEGLTGCALTGPVIRGPAGEVVFAFESFKEFDDPRPGRHAAWVMVSRDGGDTFLTPWRIAQHPDHSVYYWDQRLCEGRKPGDFTALFWTHSLAEQRDLNVHLVHGRVERDGLTLEQIRETTIPGQIAAPCWVTDDRLVALVVDRGQPGTISLWESVDHGTTWPLDRRLVIYTHDERAALTQGREAIDFKQYWEDMGKWSFGHPALRMLPDGRLLAAWYAGTPDCMSLWSAWLSVGRLRDE
jgi:hypothetical protein